MDFLDEARIYVKAGDGGRGACSFRREKYVEFGGPDGGDGGRGGDVILRVKDGLNTLSEFRYKRQFKAEDGFSGSRKARFGAAGKALFVDVPINTQIFTADEDVMLVDMCAPDDAVVIAKGGGGGLGNIRFKSSTDRAPSTCTKGWLGQEMELLLKLKLFSDIGLLGLPNAGKSTLLSAITRSKTKIGNYPFTTLVPHLGVLKVGYEELVIADLPGLIEKASAGVGLGHRFLKHVERCRLLLHIIDSSQDVVTNYKVVRNEMHLYNEELLRKPELILLNKMDSISSAELELKIAEIRSVANCTVICCSAIDVASAYGIVDHLVRFVENAKLDSISKS
ncbi:GTPase Obg/CgtA [Candidatus Cyrtobacter comes]|uniref:GTPase Obg n=1 Tax=Candidatus Cyrtobacter comes TaxID=675776 RepID=A0ABU5L6S6_9RICK|nr:GTPase ObgE [Candidatus Cyrtobacter comes]MDZ5761823.1 GTPase Obg/CgtA [Candidatus Cyrtobacter comes]